MKLNKYYRYIPLTVVIICFCYFYLYRYVYLNNSHFEKNAINTKIIRVYNYYNKSLQFYYSNKYCITTTNTQDDTLKIGDSISKPANVKAFDVYRKNKDGEYEFFKHYDNE